MTEHACMYYLIMEMIRSGSGSTWVTIPESPLNFPDSDFCVHQAGIKHVPPGIAVMIPKSAE